MKLEKQVCTLAQAKELLKLGIDVPGEGTAFYQVFDSGMKWRIVPQGYFDPFEEGVDFYPAFTVAELGVMLGVHLCRIKAVTSDNHEAIGKTIINGGVVTESEATSRATFLIFLLESGKITAAEVNQRLAAE